MVDYRRELFRYRKGNKDNSFGTGGLVNKRLETAIDKEFVKYRISYLTCKHWWQDVCISSCTKW
jgi:hypothetical protein